MHLPRPERELRKMTHIRHPLCLLGGFHGCSHFLVQKLTEVLQLFLSDGIGLQDVCVFIELYGQG